MVVEITMKAIQFNATVGADQVIRPPAGVALPVGEMEVSVRPRDASQPTDPIAATRSWLLQLAEEAELAQPDLPSDMSINHDYYAHGKPRQ
jgi:hypothetical protein